MEKLFTNIYKKDIWGSSGTGSKFGPDNKWYLKELRGHIDKYGLKTIADIGCGDWEIFKHFIFKNDETYTGLDCVEFLINDLTTKYKTHNINFLSQDVSTNIPSGYDIVILKDVIQHWTDEYIKHVLPKIIKNNKYVYCVNGYKFMRDPTKNDWTKRERDKKYHYHPISIDKDPLNIYKKHVIDIKHRRAKEYILFKD